MLINKILKYQFEIINDMFGKLFNYTILYKIEYRRFFVSNLILLLGVSFSFIAIIAKFHELSKAPEKWVYVALAKTIPFLLFSNSINCFFVGCRINSKVVLCLVLYLSFLSPFVMMKNFRFSSFKLLFPVFQLSVIL